MANTSSAKKRIRQNEKRRVRNKTVRTRTRTFVKNAKLSIEGEDIAQATSDVQLAVRELDRAAGKGVLHKKNAARRKSRLMKQLAKQSQDS